MASTILIIDDDEKLNQLMAQFLGDFGFNTLSATHPLDGLKKLKRKAPDLVILDVMLPGMDGFEVCKTIMEAHEGRIEVESTPGVGTTVSLYFPIGTDYGLPTRNFN